MKDHDTIKFCYIWAWWIKYFFWRGFEKSKFYKECMASLVLFEILQFLKANISFNTTRKEMKISIIIKFHKLFNLLELFLI